MRLVMGLTAEMLKTKGASIPRRVSCSS